MKGSHENKRFFSVVVVVECGKGNVQIRSALTGAGSGGTATERAAFLGGFGGGDFKITGVALDKESDDGDMGSLGWPHALHVSPSIKAPHSQKLSVVVVKAEAGGE